MPDAHIARERNGSVTTESGASDRYSNVINLLLFCFPVIILLVKAAGDLILLTLALTGIFVAISARTMSIGPKGLRLFAWLTWGYFSVVVLSLVFSADPAGLFHFVTRELHFLLAPFVALAISRARLDLAFLLLGIKAGLIVLGGIVFYQYFNGVGRPSAQMNADVFGNLVVMMIFLSVIRIFEERSGQRWVTLFAVLMGLAAVVLSGTRGAWLSFLLLIPVYIWLMSSRYDSVHRKVFFIVIAVLLAIVVAAANMDVVKNRVLQAVQEVELWSGGDNKHTSVGLRLEMWSAAWQAAKESPWLGYGYRNTNPVVSQYASAEVRRKISGFNHLHNEYITSFLGRGIAGLLVLLCLLFLPLRVFIAGVKNDGRCPYAAMGVLLCVGYASFGMVNVAFGDAFMNAFYVIFLALLLPVVMRRTASDH